MVGGYLFYNKPLAGLLGLPLLIFYIKKRKLQYQMRQKEQMALAFRDGMQAVVSGLYAGYSLENAFREALGELEILHGKHTPIYQGFLKMIHQVKLNQNIEDAFGEFAEKQGVEEINSFAEVLFYAKRNGGDLMTIIRNTTDAITEKIEVKREIATIISGKKIELMIMNLVPVGIILYMRITNGTMFEKLYGSSQGILIMSVCLVLYLLAYVLGEKITDIKV